MVFIAIGELACAVLLCACFAWLLYQKDDIAQSKIQLVKSWQDFAAFAEKSGQAIGLRMGELDKQDAALRQREQELLAAEQKANEPSAQCECLASGEVSLSIVEDDILPQPSRTLTMYEMLANPSLN